MKKYTITCLLIFILGVLATFALLEINKVNMQERANDTLLDIPQVVQKKDLKKLKIKCLWLKRDVTNSAKMDHSLQR